MNDEQFLNKIKESFYEYLNTSSRSNKKLKILHGAIAKDINDRLENKYEISSLGYNSGEESGVLGRYMPKKVDIAIGKDNKIKGSIGLKFIMSNYSQNSNNYFENMLGETANIRMNGKPYFQILILPSCLPYFKNDRTISYYEIITKHKLEKYINLSYDNVDACMHIPNKTLIYIVDMKKVPSYIKNKDDYIYYYLNNQDFDIVKNNTEYGFGPNVIYNNYDKFIDEICHFIESL